MSLQDLTPISVRTATYTGDVYAADFVGPVDWKYFYRGDSTLRSQFQSTVTENLGAKTSDGFLNNLSDGGLRDVMEEHGVTSQSSPFISTSSNPAIAQYYARGTGQTQNGFVTTFRLSSEDAAQFAIPNFENPVAFFEINSKIGLPESEYIFKSQIDPKFIYQQVPVGPYK